MGNYIPVDKFIARDWNKSETDDFNLRVKPRLSWKKEVIPIIDLDDKIIGWRIQQKSVKALLLES
jgi:hypothetical protein